MRCDLRYTVGSSREELFGSLDKEHHWCFGSFILKEHHWCFGRLLAEKPQRLDCGLICRSKKCPYPNGQEHCYLGY
jgi:hypothetical protein